MFFFCGCETLQEAGSFVSFGGGGAEGARERVGDVECGGAVGGGGDGEGVGAGEAEVVVVCWWHCGLGFFVFVFCFFGGEGSFESCDGFGLLVGGECGVMIERTRLWLGVL